MSGIFPNQADGAVVPSNAQSAYDPVIDPLNTNSDYFASGCNIKLRAEVLNSIISEIACVVDKAGRAYDATSRCNLHLSIAALIAASSGGGGGTTTQPVVVLATCSTTEPVAPVVGDYWMDTDAVPIALFKYVGTAFVLQPIATTAQIVVCKNCAAQTIYLNCGTAWVAPASAAALAARRAVFESSTTGVDFVVPVGITSLNYSGWGGGGGSSLGNGNDPRGGTGGHGGFVGGTIAVTPGEILTVRVGGGGKTLHIQTSGGGGGGYSGLFRGATPLFVSGGGGGGGASAQTEIAAAPFGGVGGAGGGLNGIRGTSGSSTRSAIQSAIGGQGGTPAAGGAGGVGAGYTSGLPGSSLQGGNSIGVDGIVQTNGGVNGGGNTSRHATLPASNRTGGGGGGGFFGGGGGAMVVPGGNVNQNSGGGGGGSSYSDPAATSVRNLAATFYFVGGSNVEGAMQGTGRGGSIDGRDVYDPDPALDPLDPAFTGGVNVSTQSGAEDGNDGRVLLTW